jgi:RNA polymerase sigma-70 factor, ECF subfamily
MDQRHACAPFPPSSDDDALLVERIRSGDSAAFEFIMRRYNRRLYRLARAILKNGPESEDVVQEASVRAYEKLDGFIGPSGFSAWLGKIVVNEALGRLRKRDQVILVDDHIKGADGNADVRHWKELKRSSPIPRDWPRVASFGDCSKTLSMPCLRIIAPSLCCGPWKV